MNTESLNYTVEDFDHLPPKVKKETEKLKESISKSQSAVTVDDRTYLIIALGKRPTGGYSVTVSKVEQQDSTLQVYAQEKTPAEGSMVIQVISYPLTVVSVNGHYAKEDVTFHLECAKE